LAVLASLAHAVDRDGYREYYNPLTGDEGGEPSARRRIMHL
jgi:hypothetical protein